MFCVFAVWKEAPEGQQKIKQEVNSVGYILHRGPLNQNKNFYTGKAMNLNDI